MPDSDDQLIEAGKRSVLGRAFDILDCFTHEDSEQTIGSICAHTGLAPATVHRMLASLVELGAIERCSRGRYRLGLRLWRLGWAVPDVRNLRDVARPFLVDLHSATGAMVSIGSLDCAEIMLADIIAGHAASRVWGVRRRLPLLTSAPGRVILAHAPAEILADLLPEGTRSVDFALRQQFSEIRRAGHAVVRAAEPAGLAWLAAPVFDAESQIRTTLAVAVPDRRLNVRALAPVVVEAARGISRGLGHRGAGAVHVRPVTA